MGPSDRRPHSVAVRLYIGILPDFGKGFSFPQPDPFFQVNPVKI